MGRRKCTPKQLEALRRGREKLAHKRSKKNTKGLFKVINNAVKNMANNMAQRRARGLAQSQARRAAILKKTTPIPAPVH